METTLTVSTPTNQERVYIEATSNGYIVWGGSDRNFPTTALASFESRASLQRWLSKNLVPR